MLGKKIIFGLFVSFSLYMQTAAAEERFVHIQVSHKSEKDNMRFEFKVAAANGMQLTFDGPWSLSIEENKGLLLSDEKGNKIAQQKYRYKNFSHDLPGFVVNAKKVGDDQSGKLSYKISTFSCTADKKQCFKRDYKETYTWKN